MPGRHPHDGRPHGPYRDERQERYPNRIVSRHGRDLDALSSWRRDPVAPSVPEAPQITILKPPTDRHAVERPQDAPIAGSPSQPSVETNQTSVDGSETGAAVPSQRPSHLPHEAQKFTGIQSKAAAPESDRIPPQARPTNVDKILKPQHLPPTPSPSEQPEAGPVSPVVSKQTETTSVQAERISSAPSQSPSLREAGITRTGQETVEKPASPVSLIHIKQRKMKTESLKPPSADVAMDKARLLPAQPSVVANELSRPSVPPSNAVNAGSVGREEAVKSNAQSVRDIDRVMSDIRSLMTPDRSLTQSSSQTTTREIRKADQSSIKVSYTKRTEAEQSLVNGSKDGSQKRTSSVQREGGVKGGRSDMGNWRERAAELNAQAKKDSMPPMPGQFDPAAKKKKAKKGKGRKGGDGEVEGEVDRERSVSETRSGKGSAAVETQNEKGRTIGSDSRERADVKASAKAAAVQKPARNLMDPTTHTPAGVDASRKINFFAVDEEDSASLAQVQPDTQPQQIPPSVISAVQETRAPVAEPPSRLEGRPDIQTPSPTPNQSGRQLPPSVTSAAGSAWTLKPASEGPIRNPVVESIAAPLTQAAALPTPVPQPVSRGDAAMPAPIHPSLVATSMPAPLPMTSLPLATSMGPLAVDPSSKPLRVPYPAQAPVLLPGHPIMMYVQPPTTAGMGYGNIMPRQGPMVAAPYNGWMRPVDPALLGGMANMRPYGATMSPPNMNHLAMGRPPGVPQGSRGIIGPRPVPAPIDNKPATGAFVHSQASFPRHTGPAARFAATPSAKSDVITPSVTSTASSVADNSTLVTPAAADIKEPSLPSNVARVGERPQPPVPAMDQAGPAQPGPRNNQSQWQPPPPNRQPYGPGPQRGGMVRHFVPGRRDGPFGQPFGQHQGSGFGRGHMQAGFGRGGFQNQKGGPVVREEGAKMGPDAAGPAAPVPNNCQDVRQQVVQGGRFVDHRGGRGRGGYGRGGWRGRSFERPVGAPQAAGEAGEVNGKDMSRERAKDAVESPASSAAGKQAVEMPKPRQVAQETPKQPQRQRQSRPQSPAGTAGPQPEVKPQPKRQAAATPPPSTKQPNGGAGTPSVEPVSAAGASALSPGHRQLVTPSGLKVEYRRPASRGSTTQGSKTAAGNGGGEQPQSPVVSAVGVSGTEGAAAKAKKSKNKKKKSGGGGGAAGASPNVAAAPAPSPSATSTLTQSEAPAPR
ncbi:hypothetical protein HDV00_003135 [Rhizophlyctis rosea]|nr:hypothetical protein HDV00_003135 [Rhizophlyctis rosea]